MLKIVWSYKEDPYAIRTIIVDAQSMWHTWFEMNKNEKLLVKLSNLHGNIIDANKGLPEACMWSQSYIQL